MSETNIQVTFNPAGDEKTRFSFSPVHSSMDNDARTVVLTLSTRGGNGHTARFAAPEGSRWIGPLAAGETEGDAVELAQTPDSSRTAVEVRGFPRNETDQEELYEYTVTVDFEGRSYTSRPGYPSTSCMGG